MAQQLINHGSTPGDGTGESPFSGMQKANANFTELYAAKTSLENAIATKAPINNPTFTGTVSGITKAMVGLGNVDNTSDANKPVSSAQATSILAGDNLRLKVDDVYNDFVTAGLSTPVPVNSLDGTLAAGTAYVDGIRTTLGSASTYTYLALRDTYVDIDSAGTIYRTPVVNGNAEPVLNAGRLRLEKVITDGSKIVAVTAMAPRVVKGHPGVLSTDANGNVTGLVGPDGAVLYGEMVSGTWMKCPSIFRLRLTGTGTVTIDSRDTLGNIAASVASYTVSGATDQIEFPYAGDNAVAIRATLTGTATAEVI